MARVIFSSELQKFTRETEVDIDASVFRDLVTQLVARYEDLEAETLLQMAVAIDGEIIHSPLLESIATDSEIHFLYRISGG